MKSNWSRLSCSPILLFRDSRRGGFSCGDISTGVLETEMLLRVVVEETDTELMVVTLYKTSKFRKYEGGA